MDQAKPRPPPFQVPPVALKTLCGTKLRAEKSVSDEAEFTSALKASFHDNIPANILRAIKGH